MSNNGMQDSVQIGQTTYEASSIKMLDCQDRLCNLIWGNESAGGTLSCDKNICATVTQWFNKSIESTDVFTQTSEHKDMHNIIEKQKGRFPTFNDVFVIIADKFVPVNRVEMMDCVENECAIIIKQSDDSHNLLVCNDNECSTRDYFKVSQLNGSKKFSELKKTNGVDNFEATTHYADIRTILKGEKFKFPSFSEYLSNNQ